MTSTAAPEISRPRLLAPPHRLPALGLLLVVTLVAFEALAVATVMPTTARALHGLGLYSLAFTAFLVASLIGMVDAGARTDRGGVGGVLLAGLAMFVAGLVLCAVAPSMLVFVAGRALGGLGSGAVVVALYVVVARAFPVQLRPRVFAAMAAAWVVPALVGPAIAGLIAEHLGWRWVFGGLPPFIAIGTLLLLPSLRRLPEPTEPAPDAAPAPVRRAPVGSAVLLAAGVALVQAAGTGISVLRLGLALAGLGLLALPLRRLLPPGALALRRGLPTTVVLRGLLSGAFFGAEAFLPLTLVTVHGLRPTLAGLPLTFGAVGWSLGSWLQGRTADGGVRTGTIRLGFGLVAGGLAALTVVASPAVPAAVAVPLWFAAGTGMGLAMPAISVLMLSLTPPEDTGSNSAALQISDAVGGATSIAVAGIFVAIARTAGSLPTGLAAVDLVMAAIAGFGVVATQRAGPLRR